MADTEREQGQFPASEKRRREFREKGEIAKSRDLTSAAVTIVVLVVLIMTLPQLQKTLSRHIQVIAESLIDLNYHRVASNFGYTYAAVAAPCLAAGWVSALIVGIGQTRGYLNWSMLAFNITKLNPLPKIQQMFGSVQALQQVALALLKVLVVIAVCIYSIYIDAPGLLGTSSASFSGSFSRMSLFLGGLIQRALFAVLLLALIDFAYQWFTIEQKLKMTYQELKDEARQENGDPQIRKRRRQKHQELVEQRSVKNVPEADVVLVNPTHYAVAIKYDRTKMNAPKVIAKGKDKHSERIRAIARQHGIPVVSQPPLCRLLYKRTKVGDEIPADVYEAVAVVLSYVYRIKRSAA